MPTTESVRRHARLFALIHQQARAEYTALRLERRSKRPLADPDRFIKMATRSWSGPPKPARHP